MSALSAKGDIVVNEMEHAASQFCSAVEEGRVCDLVDVYADNAEIWHNFDNVVETVEQSIAGLQRFVDTTTSRRYLHRSLATFDGGFVQRHELTVTRDGKTTMMPACIICTLRDGRIARLNSYYDSARLKMFYSTA